MAAICVCNTTCFLTFVPTDFQHISISVDQFQFLFPISQKLERPSLFIRHTFPTINEPTGEFTKG